MKRMTFLLFFISPFCFTATLSAQDIALFEEETTMVPCPTCTKSKKTVPNIGTDATPVDSIRFAPAPFPSVKVSMNDDNALPERPFQGVDMKYEKRYSDNNADYSGLSAPVDFSKKISPEIQIEKNIDSTSQAKKKVDEVLSKKTVIPTPPKKEDIEKPVFKPLYSVQNNILPTARKTVDVNTFNIADLYLEMTPEDVVDTAPQIGFEVTNIEYAIPAFMITAFEKDCRDSGLYQTRLIHECVRQTAKDEDVYYISEMILKREDTKEQIVILFSSALSGNKAFKIDYTGFGDNSLGTSYKDLLKKTNRRDVFWKYVYEKYGNPNSAQAPIWGDINGISLRAFLDGNAMDARIILQRFDQQGKDFRLAEKWNKGQEAENPFNF